jgi:hypothetical protein
VADDGQTPPQGPAGDCNSEICFKGGIARIVSFSDLPPPTAGDCRREICSSSTGAPGVPIPGFIDYVASLSDAPPSLACCGTESSTSLPDIFDPQNQCCTAVTNRVVAKYPMPVAWPIECPNRAAYPSYDPEGDYNGCGSGPIDIPDDPIAFCNGASFVTACNNHDVCYSYCRSDQAVCDTQFHSELRAICDFNCTNSFDLLSCYFYADLYHGVLQNVGIVAWTLSQLTACQCCQ